MPLADSGPAPSARCSVSGRRVRRSCTTTETGLHYNYFRYYAPETARYITPDPLGPDPAPNHHGYVANPWTWMDELGLAPCKTGTVWDDVKPTQPNYPGTEIPKSFEMQAGDNRVWVHGNASKHLNEYAQRKAREMVGPDSARISSQTQLHSLQSAVAEATKGGVPTGQLKVGGWELQFSQRPEDPLPVLSHALYRG